MQDLRYLNLFGKITKIQTKYCFMYNNCIIFAVPKKMILKAIGERGSNIKKMGEITKKRIKVIAVPNGEDDIGEFIRAIISPFSFKEIKITPEEVIIDAGSQNKAALIGRNKRRFLEMKKIVKDFFKKDFKIL